MKFDRSKNKIKSFWDGGGSRGFASCQCDLTKGFQIVELTQSSYVFKVVKEKTDPNIIRDSAGYYSTLLLYSSVCRIGAATGCHAMPV